LRLNGSAGVVDRKVLQNAVNPVNATDRLTYFVHGWRFLKKMMQRADAYSRAPKK
jgi:hypothetical protein